MIDKLNLQPLIEPHFYHCLTQSSYEILNVSSSSLLTHTRLDLGFKLFYLKNMEVSPDVASNVYDANIKACNFGRYYEYGNVDKNNLSAFLDSFKSTFVDIKENGFDTTKTLVALSYNGSIANGAHRVASCIYLGRDVSCVQIDSRDEVQDYNFFYRRNVPVDIIETAVITFVEFSKNARMFLVDEQSYKKFSSKVFENVLYQRKLTIDNKFASKLLPMLDNSSSCQDHYSDLLSNLDCNNHSTCGYIKIRLLVCLLDDVNDADIEYISRGASFFYFEENSDTFQPILTSLLSSANRNNILSCIFQKLLYALSFVRFKIYHTINIIKK